MSKQKWQHIQVWDQEGVQIVNFLDRKILGDKEVQRFGTELFSLVSPGVKLVLDYTGVKYLSSITLGKLIGLRRKIDQEGGKLAMCNIEPQTLVIFKNAKLDEYFTILEDRKAAIQRVS